MKSYLFILLFLGAALSTHAQKNMTIYGELLGNGLFFSSLNVEYNFGDPETGFGVRTGLSILLFSPFEYTVPVMGHYLIGEKKHKLELGLGLLFVQGGISLSEANPINSTGITSTIMYRYHGEAGWMWRVGFAPFYGNNNLLPMPGLSTGYRF